MKAPSGIILTLAVALTVVVPVFAADNSTSPGLINVKQVEYGNGAPPFLLIGSTGGLNYGAYIGTAQCDGAVLAPTADTVKVWASLAQAALLSGKSLQVYWNDCGTGGTRYLADVILRSN